MGKRSRSIIRWVGFWLAVLCSAALAEERFTVNPDGTVADHELGVMWARESNPGDINWHQAKQWVKYTFPDTIPAGYDDWRLPTLEELASLYVRNEGYKGYETDCGQRVKIVPEIQLTCGWIWTSERKSITARVYNFNRGYHYTNRMVHYRAYRALPVRDME